MRSSSKLCNAAVREAAATNDRSTQIDSGTAVTTHQPTLSPPARLLIAALRGYQAWLSPLFAALGARCRFEPSCSQYALDAVQARGPLRGLGLAAWRLLRCNPFNAGGYDPVAAGGRRGESDEGDETRRPGMRCFT